LEPNYAMAWVSLGDLFKLEGKSADAREAYGKAQAVYLKWKDADRIDPVEKEMVSLPPETVAYLQKETAP